MLKKIVFTVTPIFSIPPKGAAAVETWMYEVAQRLSVENKIVCIKNEGYSDFTQVNEKTSIHRIGFSKIYKRLFQKWTRLDPLPYSQRILNIKNDFASDVDSVIVVHNSLKLYRQIRKRSPEAHLVLHMHNAFEPQGIDPNAKIIVPSLFLQNYYRQFLPAADIVIVPNGIDLNAYTVDAKTKNIRGEFGISETDTVLFYAGRIVPDKGVLLLLKAFEKISKQRNEIKLVVIGDPHSSEKGEKATYQQQARELSARLRPDCIMVGSVRPEEMHKYYPLADLVIIPSQFEEPFCMVAIEAMAANKPVLVSTRGGMIEFVQKDSTGYHLSEPMTAESIQRDIEKVLNDPEKSIIAAKGQRLVYNEYSWDRVTALFEDKIRYWFP
ncbi:lipopolysaccharide N-acetylglucosaminyltransferase [Dryocola clanedunensis]|uniref:lipopolysaccharide N-acetylglucosaminyltransferase n=1 Tax=Cedecea sulfonylureivorans TaxID=3051154 RepID=UPI0019285775|nr:lipopolysaccharide N-acetylglucosaminyltransferase [Cedecea sulfonylureivorans]